MGARLLTGMRTLTDLQAVGEVRGLGLMVAVELVADRGTKAAFDPAKKIIGKVKSELEARGVFTGTSATSCVSRRLWSSPPPRWTDWSTRPAAPSRQCSPRGRRADMEFLRAFRRPFLTDAERAQLQDGLAMPAGMPGTNWLDH